MKSLACLIVVALFHPIAWVHAADAPQEMRGSDTVSIPSAAGPDTFLHVTIPGVASSKLELELKGLVLIEELNCVACHAASTGGTESADAPSLTVRSKKAPRLSGVGSRVNPGWLEMFIGNPHGIKPGTTMPDVLTQLGTEEKRETVTALVHFLLSLKESDFALQPPDAVAARHGKRLFHARGCAACHSPRDDFGAELSIKNSVPLGPLEKKYSFKSLTDFLREPHVSRPSGRMPDMRLAAKDVERIAHYLLQHTRVPGRLSYTLYRGDVWEGLESENVTAERAGHVNDFALESLGMGRIQQHTAIHYVGWMNIANAGRHTFFLKMNGGSLSVNGEQLIRHEPSDRRGVMDLEATADLAAAWHSIELTYFHTGREAQFSFELEGPQLERGPIPTTLLSISNEPIAPFAPFKVDAELAARGKQHFGQLGCANCHDDLGVQPKSGPAWGRLDARRGCLGESAGTWPQFELDREQHTAIASALSIAEKPQLDDRQQLDKSLVTFNCIACHERADVGGIDPERDSLFTGTQPELGDQGRLPPPLSNVGAKLQSEWLSEVLLRGKRQRDYVETSMPQFGDGNVGHLVGLFDKVDILETASIPEVVDIQEFKNAGHEMMGTGGLSCIVCHEFNGQKSGEISALDLARVPGRLKKNWFHLYMRQPSRFHPTVIMPIYWPDGQSPLPKLLDGDAGRQIEAIWTYLEDGVRARKPLGLSRESNELRVGDVTEICRGQSPVGYRGIGVGYPERLNLAFDSGEMALRQLWKGEFVSIDSGRFNPRGTDPIFFPPGIPFHRLRSLDDNWPYKGKSNHPFPQDHGYQFRGYHLDAARRPTFLYHYGEIAVEDFFEDMPDMEGKPYFKRTLGFQTAAEQIPFYFRAAVGTKVVTQSDRNFVVDKLQLRITSNHRGIVREGDTSEVLIPLTLPRGRTVLTLEYQW